MTNATAQAVPIPAGALFTITTGIYSDYSVHGVFRAKAEIDTEALLKDWFESHPDQTDNYCFLSRDFIASLTHLLEPVECWEFHVDEYNTAIGNCVTRMD